MTATPQQLRSAITAEDLAECPDAYGETWQADTEAGEAFARQLELAQARANETGEAVVLEDKLLGLDVVVTPSPSATLPGYRRGQMTTSMAEAFELARKRVEDFGLARTIERRAWDHAIARIPRVHRKSLAVAAELAQAATLAEELAQGFEPGEAPAGFEEARQRLSLAVGRKQQEVREALLADIARLELELALGQLPEAEEVPGLEKPDGRRLTGPYLKARDRRGRPKLTPELVARIRARMGAPA